MRQASAVSVRCTGRGAWRLAQAGLVGLAVAAWVAWSVAWILPQVAWLAAAPAGLAVAWRVHARLRLPEGMLQWTGSVWRFDEQPLQAVDLMLDLGAAVLLRLRPAAASARPAWVLVTAAAAGAGYRPLCAVLHGRGRR